MKRLTRGAQRFFGSVVDTAVILGVTLLAAFYVIWIGVLFAVWSQS
jgi:hypothetical protein